MQTIKRTAAIFLVLMLVLSCFTPVLTASASEPPGSAPAQTAATSPGADDPSPEITAATEQTALPTVETTEPTEETLPPRQMVSTLASFLDNWDASVSITFSDGFQVEAGTQLEVSGLELDDDTLTACMEAAGFLNILDYCVLNLDIPDADWEGTSFEMKVYFNSSAFRALNGSCVSVVRLLPDGTVERLEATPPGGREVPEGNVLRRDGLLPGNQVRHFVHRFPQHSGSTFHLGRVCRPGIQLHLGGLCQPSP